MSENNTNTVAHTNLIAVARERGVEVSPKLAIVQRALQALAVGEYDEQAIKEIAKSCGVPSGIVKIQATFMGLTLSRGRTAVATVESVGSLLESLTLDANDNDAAGKIADALGLKTEGLVSKILRDSFGRTNKRGRTAQDIDVAAIHRNYLDWLVMCATNMARPHAAALDTSLFSGSNGKPPCSGQRAQAEFEAAGLASFAGCNFSKEPEHMIKVLELLEEYDAAKGDAEEGDGAE